LEGLDSEQNEKKDSVSEGNPYSLFNSLVEKDLFSSEKECGDSIQTIDVARDRGFESISCELCLKQVLKTSYEHHVKKCRNRIQHEKQLYPIPTADFSIDEIRRFATLNDLKVNTRLASTRRKSEILSEITSLLPKPTVGRMKQTMSTMKCPNCKGIFLTPGISQHVKQCKTKYQHPDELAPIKELAKKSSKLSVVR